MDRQVLASLFDELEKIGMGKPKVDPIRGRPVEAVKVRLKDIPPMVPSGPVRPTAPEDLDFLVSQGFV